MASSSQEPLLPSEEEEEDLVFDRAGLLNHHNPIRSSLGLQSRSSRLQLARTANLCFAFFALGLCFALPTATLDDLLKSINLTSGGQESTIEYIYMSRYSGYVFGALLGGLLFDRYNRQFLLFLSLLCTAIGVLVMPFCTVLGSLMACTAITGITMGFLDTGGNVWCLDLWGKKSAPVMQALHFFFALGAFVAPLVAEPFLSPQMGAPAHLDINMRPQSNMKVLSVGFNHGPPGPEIGGHSLRKRELAISNGSLFENSTVYTTASFGLPNVTTEAILIKSTRKSKPMLLDGNQLYHEPDPWQKPPSRKKGFEKPPTPAPLPPPSTSSSPSLQDNATTVMYSVDKQTHPSSSNSTELQLQEPTPALVQKILTAENTSVNDSEHSTNSFGTAQKSSPHVLVTISPSPKITVTGQGHPIPTLAISLSPSATMNGAQSQQTASEVIDASTPIQKNIVTSHQTTPKVVASPSPSGTAPQQMTSNITPSITSIIASSQNSSKTLSTQLFETTRSNIAFSSSEFPISTVNKKPYHKSLHANNTLPTPNSSSINMTRHQEATTSKDLFSLHNVNESSLEATTNRQSLDVITPASSSSHKPDYAPTRMTYEPKTFSTHSPSLKPSSSNMYINDNPPPMNEKENEESINEDAETTPVSYSNMSYFILLKNQTRIKEKDFFTRLYETMQHRRLGKFEFAYVILAVYLFIISIVFLVFLCLNPREGRSRQEDDLDKTHFFTSSFKISVVTLMSLFLCLYVGIQVAVGQLLKTFATEQVQLSKPTGYFLSYMFWGSFALSRSLSILLTGRFSAIRLLITDLIVCLVASIVLVAGASKVEALLWVGIVVLAMGMAPVFPLALSWIEHYIPVTNKIASLFILGEALGELAIPRVIERFINQEPMVLMYMNIVINLLCSVTFGALWLLASRQGSKYKTKPIRTLYQLANTSSDDFDFELSSPTNHNNGDACSLLPKRRNNRILSPA